MSIQKRFSPFCLAMVASSFLYVPTASALDGNEVATLKSLSPFITEWKKAIANKDVTAAKNADEKYEVKWQGLEVYVNHRSLPLYRDMEVETQFAMEAELKKEKPDFALLSKQVSHLKGNLDTAILMAKAAPTLSPFFDDLVPLRGLRSKSITLAKKALKPDSLDIAKAKSSFLIFKVGFPSVIHLIDARSTTAGDEIQAALDVADAVFSNSNATVEQMTAANDVLINRYGFGVNLVNAAARTANVNKFAINDFDKKNLTQLNVISQALLNDLPAAGETGTNSAFAVLQPTLESLGRSINIVGTLRSALLTYDNLVKAKLPDIDAIKSAKKAALEAIAITQQALVGQFWESAELQTFLNSLPKV